MPQSRLPRIAGLIAGLIGGAALVLSSTGAYAGVSVLLKDGFDAENGGQTGLNYTGFANWTVVSGTVDINADGDYGVRCVGGEGGCVDLDGSSNQGGFLVSRQTFDYAAGDTVLLSFQMSGNQRHPLPPGSLGEGWKGLIRFPTLIDLSDLIFGYNGAIVHFGPVSGAQGLGWQRYDPWDEGFNSYVAGFVAPIAGTFKLEFLSLSSNDNEGAILDDVLLTRTSAAPEPATWVLLMSGIAALGAAVRRRRASHLV